MTQKFLNKYFSTAKISRLRNAINNFAQSESELVYEAWDRFKRQL